MNPNQALRNKKGRYIKSTIETKMHRLATDTSNAKRKLQRASRDLRELALDSTMGQGNYSQILKEINQIHDKLLLQINLDYKKRKPIAKALDAGPVELCKLQSKEAEPVLHQAEPKQDYIFGNCDSYYPS
ncbi:hypothetical protein D3C81_787270 [compost metagenome]